MRRLVTMLAVALTPTYPAPAATTADAADTAELKRLDGVWRVVSSEEDGVEQPPVQLPDRLLLTFTAGNFERGGGQRGAVQRLGIGTQPKTIDYRHAGTEKDVLGLYLVEGDILVECKARPGDPRPSGFTSAKGSGHTLVVYKRVKKKID